MSSEAPRPSRWQICVVPASPWRALTHTNTALSHHLSAQMEWSLFIVLRCEENVKVAKAVSSPGSTPLVFTRLRPLLHRALILQFHSAGHRWLICSDMNLALCGEEPEQRYGWMNVPLWGLSHQRASLQLFTHVNVEHPCCEYIWRPSGCCSFPMVWMCRRWGRGATVYCGHVHVCVRVVVTLPHSYLSVSCASSPPPLVCAFPPLFLTLGREEQELLHYIDGESSPTLLTHAQRIYTILWSCRRPRAVGWALHRLVFQVDALDTCEEDHVWKGIEEASEKHVRISWFVPLFPYNVIPF